MHRFDSAEGLDKFLWALIYREGPFLRSKLADIAAIDADQLESSLQRLIADGRVRAKEDQGGVYYESSEFFVPLGEPAGAYAYRYY
jgi:hypothetical protein